MIRCVVMGLFVLVHVASVAAQAPECDGLTKGQKKLVQRILESEYMYDCCDDTIEVCLQQESPSRLAGRLARNVCRRVAEGQDESRIKRAMSRRARGMMGGGEQAEINLANAPAAGAAEAPVVVVVYACARCPYCSKLVPALYEAATDDGPLKGKVQLAFRVFPIKGHEGSTAGGLAFVAAHEFDAFWPYMLTAYEQFDVFSPEVLDDWAVAAGIDRQAFDVLVAKAETRSALVESKKEGLANGVEETPTVFINGRRWVGDLEVEELIDAIGEEADRAEGVLCSTEP